MDRGGVVTQYLLSVHMVEGGPQRTPEETERAYQQVDRLNTELQATGAWVFGGGLMPADEATVVQQQGAEMLMTDGPFVEGKEHIGGFWVIEADSLESALAWA